MVNVPCYSMGTAPRSKDLVCLTLLSEGCQVDSKRNTRTWSVHEGCSDSQDESSSMGVRTQYIMKLTLVLVHKREIVWVARLGIPVLVSTIQSQG